MNLDLKKKISKSSHQINQVFYTSSERFFNVKYQCFGSLKVCVGNFISKKTPPPSGSANGFTLYLILTLKLSIIMQGLQDSD